MAVSKTCFTSSPPPPHVPPPPRTVNPGVQEAHGGLARSQELIVEHSDGPRHYRGGRRSAANLQEELEGEEDEGEDQRDQSWQLSSRGGRQHSRAASKHCYYYSYMLDACIHVLLLPQTQPESPPTPFDRPLFHSLDPLSGPYLEVFPLVGHAVAVLLACQRAHVGVRAAARVKKPSVGQMHRRVRQIRRHRLGLRAYRECVEPSRCKYTHGREPMEQTKKNNKGRYTDTVRESSQRQRDNKNEKRLL